MKITINTQDLLDGINTVTKALAPRPSKQILEGILITAEDQSITLTCSDGNLTITTVLLADIFESGKIVLPGRLFGELVRKLPGGSVTLKVFDNFSTQIQCMKSKSNLMGMDPMEYPEISSVNNGVDIKISQNILKDMISRTSFAIATDENRQILTGALLEVSHSEARFVALDGFRLAIQKISQPFELSETMETMKAVIPGRVLNELSRILNDDEAFCTMTFSKTHMKAVFGNNCLSTTLLAGEFIDYRRILPSSFRTEVKVNRSMILEAIERASLMAREGKNNLVRLSFSEEKGAVASNAEMGDINEELECELTGDPIDIAFNAKYINEVIRNIPDDEIYMKMNTNVSPCVISPRENEKYLYLILPVRVFQ